MLTKENEVYLPVNPSSRVGVLKSSKQNVPKLFTPQMTSPVPFTSKISLSLNQSDVITNETDEYYVIDSASDDEERKESKKVSSPQNNLNIKLININLSEVEKLLLNNKNNKEDSLLEKRKSSSKEEKYYKEKTAI